MLMQLDTLISAPFAARVGKCLTAETSAGDFALEVINVKENPRGAGSNAKRIPFSVVLRGAASPCLSDDSYTLRADDEESWRLEGVYVNRIIPPSSTDGQGAFYQVIFS